MAIIHVFLHTTVVSQLPQHFEKNGHTNPDNVYDSPFQYAMNTTPHCFDWFEERRKE